MHLPGLPDPTASEIFRISDLSGRPPAPRSGGDADAGGDAGGGGGDARAGDENESASAPPATAPASRPGQWGNFPWGETRSVDLVASADVYGEGSALFGSLKAVLSGPAAAAAATAATTPSPRVSTAAAAASASVVIDLVATGRGGQRVVGSAELALQEAFVGSRGGDLLRKPARLYSERGQTIAEVSVSLALLGALTAVHEAVRPLRGQPSQKGAAIAIGAGEAYLLQRSGPIRKLNPTRIWLEVDMRRACATLLRSGARPAYEASVDFGLKELLFVADGSPQQARLSALLDPATPSAHADVIFSVYGTPARREDATEEGEAEGAPASGGVAPPAAPPALVGRGRVSLLELHRSGGEMVCLPLELRDSEGSVCGILSVSLLAREALLAARQHALRASRSAQLWLGCEGLSLTRTAVDDPYVAAVWLECELQAHGATSDSLASRRQVIKRRPVAAAAADGGGGGGMRLELHFKESVGVAAGSELHTAIKKAVRRSGGVATQASPSGPSEPCVVFRLMAAGVASAVPHRAVPLHAPGASASAEQAGRLPGGSSRELGRAKLRLGEALLHGSTTDAIQLPLEIRDSRGILMGALYAHTEGLGGLRRQAAATEPRVADVVATSQERLATAARRGDVEEMQRSLEGGAMIGKKDAWGQTALHWAAAGYEGEAAVQKCLEAGASVHAANIAGSERSHTPPCAPPTSLSCPTPA